MPFEPLTSDDQLFIQNHLTADVQTLLLRPPAGLDGAHLRELAGQIQARQKARFKLPTWYARPDREFPPSLSVEQASSEAAAAYKASLVGSNRLADLTGGMGVDTAAFARTVTQVDYVERNETLAQRTAFNLNRLGLTNVTVHPGDGLDWLSGQAQPPDWLYLDPARRDGRGGRVVGLADCEPDVLTYLPQLLAKTGQLLLKTSPLLDIEATLRQLLTTQAVHVVAVQGEVKETLFVLGQSPVATADVPMVAVDLRDRGAVTFPYRRGDETTAPVQLTDPQTYLYEPNAAVLKAGAFRLAGARFGLNKLAPHSHLYTADTLVAGYPGRVFQVQATCRADRKSLAEHVPGGQANLTVRNFPQPVEVLRKQLGLREGGDTYLFATTLRTGDRRLLVTRKVGL